MKLRTAKHWVQKPTFKVWSVTAEIFLIWTNVVRTNVDLTNITETVEICSRWSEEPTFKVWSKLGQWQLRYSWYGQMLLGQVLPGQMSSWQLTDGPRSLPLKFGQNRTRNSWDPSGRFWWGCCYSSSSPSSCYRGKTKSTDFSLGLGLEFDKNKENAKNKDEPKNKDNLKNPVKKRCFDYTIKNRVPSKKVYLLLFIYCMARLLLL